MNFVMLTQALSLPWWVIGLINFFAADDADKTAKNEDNEFADDDMDDLSFGDDDQKEDEEEDDDDDDGDDEDEKKSKDGNKSKDKAGKKDTSAVIQKQKYRKALKDARDEIERLKNKGDEKGSLTPEEKREKAAQEYLAKEIEKAIAARDAAKASEDAKELEAFQDEMDEILEENEDISEKELLAICEELDVMPSKALLILQRESKMKGGKKKPNLPQSKRGSGDIRDDDKKKSEPKTLDQINREIKEGLKSGRF